MTLTFNIHIPSRSQLVVCIYQLSGHRLQYFLKNPLFSLFPKKPKFPNLTLPKIGQGHSRVIIYINYDGQESPILHTKFCENQPAGSREEDF